MYNATIADLNVSNRVVYTLNPTKELRAGGLANVKKAAIMEALTANGNADLMLEPEFVVARKKGPLGLINKVTSVTVSGRPATYKNFRATNDSVWCNPTFRSAKVNNGVEDSEARHGLLQKLFKK